MKIQLLIRALVGVSFCLPPVVFAACSSTTDPVPAPAKDASTGMGTDSGPGPADTGPAVVDSGSDAGTGTPAPGTFGANCDASADCTSMVCFVGGMRNFCSSRCDSGADCPKPPSTGVCNNKGYCK